MSEIVKAAAPNTAKYPMDGMQTEEVIAWVRGVAAASAMAKTKLVYTDYVNGIFHNWFVNYDASLAEEPAPGVPLGFDAEVDETTFRLISSGTPAGPMPAYKKRVITPSGGIKSTLPLGGMIFGAIGAEITQLDGTVWKRLS